MALEVLYLTRLFEDLKVGMEKVVGAAERRAAGRREHRDEDAGSAAKGHGLTARPSREDRSGLTLDLVARNDGVELEDEAVVALILARAGRGEVGYARLATLEVGAGEVGQIKSIGSNYGSAVCATFKSADSSRFGGTRV